MLNKSSNTHSCNSSSVTQRTNCSSAPKDAPNTRKSNQTAAGTVSLSNNDPLLLQSAAATTHGCFFLLQLCTSGRFNFSTESLSGSFHDCLKMLKVSKPNYLQQIFFFFFKGRGPGCVCGKNEIKGRFYRVKKKKKKRLWTETACFRLNSGLNDIQTFQYQHSRFLLLSPKKCSCP